MKHTRVIVDHSRNQFSLGPLNPYIAKYRGGLAKISANSFSQTTEMSSSERSNGESRRMGGRRGGYFGLYLTLFVESRSLKWRIVAAGGKLSAEKQPLPFPSPLSLLSAGRNVFGDISSIEATMARARVCAWPSLGRKLILRTVPIRVNAFNAGSLRR